MVSKREKKISKNGKRIQSNKKNSKTIAVIAAVTVLAISGGLTAFILTSNPIEGIDNTNNNKNSNLGEWMDIHGIGMFPDGNDNSLYIATHNGLFKKDVYSNSSGWIEIGNDRSDLMGFVISPTHERIMYSSGHPQTGGNLGFRKSTDSGVTWQTVSDVTNPPIDFHAMTVSKANPQIIYGSSGRGDTLYATSDEGNTWTELDSPDGAGIMTLAAHPLDSNIVYTGTMRGLFFSDDQGKRWQKIDNVDLIGNGAIVSGIGFKSDNKTAYAFVIPNQNEEGYIIKSEDGAKTWVKSSGQIDGSQFIGKFDFGRKGEVYATVHQDAPDGNTASNIYQSNDGGASWILVGTNNKSILT